MGVTSPSLNHNLKSVPLVLTANMSRLGLDSRGCPSLLSTRTGELRAQKAEFDPDRHLVPSAPNAHEHINTKGVITIDVSPYRGRLLDGGSRATEIRTAKCSPSFVVALSPWESLSA